MTPATVSEINTIRNEGPIEGDYFTPLTGSNDTFGAVLTDDQSALIAGGIQIGMRIMERRIRNALDA